MLIGAPKETWPGERRVAMTPKSAKALQKLGYTCAIESGAGEASGFDDDAYRQAGVEVVPDAETLFARADVVIKVRQPTVEEVDRLRPGQKFIGFFYPRQEEALMKRAAARGATVLAMDMIPRTSRAQKMDALSSMANVAGYRAVVEAAENFGRFLNGQITAAGKVQPAKVLVIGAGVAGLAAIGAAVSLGAVVRAFDVRPEVAEEIESMGAEFLMLDFSDAGLSSEDGYAKPASPEFIEREMALFREQAPDVDIVITTALIPGRPAPRLWTADMVKAMKRGSVIVDLAAEQGGNCELTKPGERAVTDNGVVILGYTDMPSRMAAQASELYATNIRHLLTDMTPDKDGEIVVDFDDEVIRHATVVRDGEITFPPPPVAVSKAKRKPAEKPKELTAEEKRALELEAFRKETRQHVTMLGIGGALLLLAGAFAPASFMAHFVVFVLAVFVGYYVVWNVAHSLHTPLMAVTNAISGIIIVGALLQVGSGNPLVMGLAAVALLIGTINIAGGFLVTRRMLAMFQKS